MLGLAYSSVNRCLVVGHIAPSQGGTPGSTQERGASHGKWETAPAGVGVRYGER